MPPTTELCLDGIDVRDWTDSSADCCPRTRPRIGSQHPLRETDDTLVLGTSSPSSGLRRHLGLRAAHRTEMMGKGAISGSQQRDAKCMSDGQVRRWSRSNRYTRCAYMENRTARHKLS